AAENASHYDLYIWPSDEAKPSNPRVSNIGRINYNVNGLQYGRTYNWQITGKNSCLSNSGPVQTFSLRELPDLRVKSIQTPSAIYSGQNLTVSWEVENTGLGTTGSQPWKDGVYLSLDTLFSSGNDVFLGDISNLNYLAEGQSYVQTASFAIPHN